MSVEKGFIKENPDYYLKELTKEFRKNGKNTPAEIILVSGIRFRKPDRIVYGTGTRGSIIKKGDAAFSGNLKEQAQYDLIEI